MEALFERDYSPSAPSFSFCKSVVCIKKKISFLFRHFQELHYSLNTMASYPQSSYLLIWMRHHSVVGLVHTMLSARTSSTFYFSYHRRTRNIQSSQFPCWVSRHSGEHQAMEKYIKEAFQQGNIFLLFYYTTIQLYYCQAVVCTYVCVPVVNLIVIFYFCTFLTLIPVCPFLFVLFLTHLSIRP